ncbi:MAG: hypothetical protein ACOX2Z_03735 [Minisyncoccales bacterium]|jgi:hypothetical protein
MEKQSLIRKVYLYLFSSIGLILAVVGVVRFLDMGLREFIFTDADNENLFYSRMTYKSPEDIRGLSEEGRVLIENELRELESIIADHDYWELARELDPQKARRHREASSNLAAILVGIPLYLFHWNIIKKESNN